MLLSALDLGFHSSASFSPLVHYLVGFFVTTLLCKFRVFKVKPESFKLLFDMFLVHKGERIIIDWFTGRNIAVVIGLALKTILVFKLDRYLIICIELIKRLSSNGSFGLAKGSARLCG